jgi:hypothetical protein
VTHVWGDAVLVCGQCGLHVVAERERAPPVWLGVETEQDQQQGLCDLRVEHVLLAQLVGEQHGVQWVDGELHGVQWVDGELHGVQLVDGEAE